MDNESARLEDRVQRLEQVVAELLQRVNAGDQRPPLREARATAPAETGERSDAGADSNAYLALVGRTFLVLGGAFLLRALTDSGQLPRATGVVCGFAYALVWLIASHRAAPRQRLSSIFHGGAALIIAFPLLWESATRFALLSPSTAAVAMLLLTSLALAVAWHDDLAPVATLAMLGASGFALALLVSTQQFIPFTILLVLVGVATLWLGYVRHWLWLPWVPALVVDAVIASLILGTLRGDLALSATAVIAIQFGLLGAYLGSFALHTRLRHQLIGPFEVVQAAAIAAIGLIGAAVVSHHSGVGAALVGSTSLLVGAVAYLAAFSYLRARDEFVVNFYFYASVGLACTLVGGIVLLPATAAAIFFAIMAVATASLCKRLAQSTLLLHAAVYSVVAAAVVGCLSLVAAALVAAPAAEWPGLPLAAWLVLAATATLVVWNRPSKAGNALGIAQLSHAFLVFLLTLEVSALVVAHLAPAIAGTPADAGALATIRTVVLATAAVLLAIAKYWEPGAVPGWLIYGVHAAIGLKLVAEDLRHSEPATLFVALGVFGVALILTARLLRRPPPVANAAG